MYKTPALMLTDGYKIGHVDMLAPNTSLLYGTWIGRSLKHAPEGVTKILSFGQQMTWRWINDQFVENFFNLPKEEAVFEVAKDLSLYLGLPYNADHFEALYDLGYLPMHVKALPEGIETPVGIPHMTFINTVSGFAWLTLYLETIVSSLAWKPTTSASIALQYNRNATKWVMKTNPEQAYLIPYLAHDFSARGLDPWTMISSGLGHATSFRGSDTLPVISAARYFYDEPKGEVAINSVNASEHSVTTTGIFYYEKLLKAGKLNEQIERYYSFDTLSEGSVENPDYRAIAEWLNLSDWLKRFPEGILSVVSDTFDLWKLIIYILPRLKGEILARNGKLVIRPDSGNPVDITCGRIEVVHELHDTPMDVIYNGEYYENKEPSHPKYEVRHGIKSDIKPADKGVIELLWDIFGGTVNAQGYKVLDPHIGSIYGDSITLSRQVQIYERLAAKGFAATNIVLGVGSYTYQYNTRDTFGFAAKGAWFQTKTPSAIPQEYDFESYNIYKEPITDDGTKKSLKGLQAVFQDENGEYFVKSECTWKEEKSGLLQTIFLDGKFQNITTLTEIRNRISKLV